MNKKAQGLSLNMIIVAAIGFIVLIIVAIIFRTQIIDFANKYRDTADKTIESAEGERCVTFFTTRICSADSPQPSEEWKKISPEKEKWTDCKENEECWEKIK